MTRPTNRSRYALVSVVAVAIAIAIAIAIATMSRGPALHTHAVYCG
jgi:hypothetical protein